MVPQTGVAKSAPKPYLWAMIDDALTTVAFTGHRNYRSGAGEALMRTLEELHARGFRTFLSGMAAGFDLAAAEAVVALRARHPDVRLVAVVPFRGQERLFTPEDRARYALLLAAADRTELLSECYHRGCYLRRNDWLINHASTLVAWYDGSEGGTRYTVARALRMGRTVLHLHPRAPASVARDPELFG